MKDAGVRIFFNGVEITGTASIYIDDLERYTDSELKDLLRKHESNEEYEICARIKERLEFRAVTKAD